MAGEGTGNATGTRPGSPASAAWVVDIEVSRGESAPSGEPLLRDALVGRLWAAVCDHGLLGIDEGCAGVEEAAAAGLVATPLVIDAAAAPVERDWVGDLGGGTLACWFGAERDARSAAAVLARTPGCTVLGVRAELLAVDPLHWRDAFGAIRVAGFGTVRPAWDGGDAAAGAGGATIFIDPGAGFGTGLHETTQLCLAAIAAWVGRGGSVGRVLDLGSGSGILAVAAAVLGASRVDAVEIDGRLHGAIRGNASRNGVAERLAVSECMPSAGPYDLVVANIVPEVLVAEAERISAAVSRDAAGRLAGGVVLSGLLAADVARVVEAYEGPLGTRGEETRAGEWRSISFRPAVSGGASPRARE